MASEYARRRAEKREAKRLARRESYKHPAKAAPPTVDVERLRRWIEYSTHHPSWDLKVVLRDFQVKEATGVDPSDPRLVEGE